VNSLRLLGGISGAGNRQSEDCLTLNVWTKPQTGDKAKAVLFWIYGGGMVTDLCDSAVLIMWQASRQEILTTQLTAGNTSPIARMLLWYRQSMSLGAR